MKKGLVIVLLAVAVQVGAQSTDGLTEVFVDNFANNKNGWLIAETGKETSWVNYNEQRLVVDASKGASRITMTAPKGFNGDFVLKATIWCKDCSGNKEASFGLLVGYSQFATKGEEGWYQMQLNQENGDGVWVKANNPNGSTLYEQNAKAGFDPDDRNEIAIERKGEDVKYYVNGSEVFSNTSTETSGNKITFMAGGKTKVFMSKISFHSN